MSEWNYFYAGDSHSHSGKRKTQDGDLGTWNYGLKIIPWNICYSIRNGSPEWRG